MQVWDVRMLQELATCRGHSTDVAMAVWNPWQEEAFVSGDYEGTILHWLLSRSGPQVCVGGWRGCGQRLHRMGRRSV